MICTEKDKFITEYIEGQPSWEVVLNDGTRVYQDDYRPGVSPPSAWVRLGKYCKANNLYIVDMYVRFRSNIKHVGSDCDGYYFCKGSRGSMGGDRTMQLFYAGTLVDDKLEVQCWKTPEMIIDGVSERDVNKVGLCLISKNTSQSMVPQI